MKVRVNIGCESCSCGSVDQIVLEIHRGSGEGHDYECNNCGSRTTIFIEPVSDDTPIGLITDDE